ncbi:unnamed protein product [Symbiodinium necroappetens]|uniref:C2H2-type domain-containing protein n=1 Tax=Symbiodinium necroappetens TaxID=1628268 RepID=A0A813AT43_9DINO|nr:unnamed protein product [Symbiodinium necroappetens]
MVGDKPRVGRTEPGGIQGCALWPISVGIMCYLPEHIEQVPRGQGRSPQKETPRCLLASGSAAGPQYLTESRRQYWANWEYQATHERRPRSVPDDGLCAADGQDRDAKRDLALRRGSIAAERTAEPDSGLPGQIRDGHANEQVQNKYQVCVVQETHWSASSEYLSGKWLCIHSAPAPADAAADRYAGLLVMLSRAHFQDPAVHEVIGGRVVHVRAKPKRSDVSLDIVVTYQHVWRSHLSTQENTKLRDSVWDALDVTLGSLPSRNILFACGDYNTNLRPQHPHVGNAVGPATSASTIDSRLPTLFARWRLAGHLPIEAQLPMLPVHWRPGRPQTTSPSIDKASLLEAATSCNADAAALQTLVAEKLQDLPIRDPHALHTRVNHILQQCVQQVFPPPPIADSRVSAQAPLRASARQTWRLYALLRRPRVATIAVMLHKWKLYLAFARASRALRQQCKDIKRTAFAAKLLQAEEAAQRGDQRTLFQIVRSLTPSPGRVFSRLRDDEGQLLSKNAEVQALATKAAKAVPSHLAPAHLDIFGETSLPIGLMGPPSKALAGALRDRMLEQLSQLVTQRPQFAYTAGRGTLNALLRIHMHVAEATKLFRLQQISRFGMYAGRRPLALAGALSLSLDLSRAFDLADRCSIYSTLEKYQVPHAVVEVVQRLHTGARFVYQAGNHTAAFVPTNGLKQGCKVAPCLWVWYTIALFDTLEERLSEAWVRHTPTMFADDCWAHWLIKSSDDLQRALRELQILLCTLEDYKMRINFSKTAILLKLVGKQAQNALRAHTRLKQGLPHLVVLVNGRTQLIPIKTEHEYLGSKAGQLRYHSIQKSLTGRHAITQAHRIRLWAACVFTSTIYSLAAVGLTTQGLQKWETRTLKHLRAIMRKPAHLTRVTNATIWQQAGLRQPGEQLLDQLQQARAKLELRARVAPDITTEAGVLDYLRQHETHLRLLIQREQGHPPTPIPVRQYVCQHCEAVFLTERALHIHCGIKHPAPASEAGRPEPKHLFDPAQHSVGGLPHCRACGRKFTKWQYLKHHIEVELRAELQPPTQNSRLIVSCATSGTALNASANPSEASSVVAETAPGVPDESGLQPGTQSSVRCSINWSLLRGTASNKPHEMPSDSIMSPDGQGINPEADIFRYVNFQNSTSQRGQGSDTSEGQPTKRPRPEQPATRQRRHPKQPGRPFGASALGPHQDTIKTLTKVIIRQEDQLAELRGDKGFCLFLREDPEVSILPALIQISKDWHARQDARDATLKSPLRTLLMACLIRRLRELMVLMTSTPESVKKLQAADWMNQAEEWTYFKWSHQEKRLVRDTDKEVGDANATTALFFLSVSLRGPVAQQVHEHLVQLIGVSALMLIGASLKRKIPRRAAIVQQLAEAVFN